MPPRDVQFVTKLLRKKSRTDDNLLGYYVQLSRAEAAKVRRIGLPTINRLALLQGNIDFRELTEERKLYFGEFHP